ncbi:LCP family protein [Bacillus marasmi]|uniref:LCP family protein n=1 Tax=Bacillus marasmi TaxID=1926279 RepID=UPI00164DB9AC|nr:LCP family protein [Bacillus marasmi]
MSQKIYSSRLDRKKKKKGKKILMWILFPLLAFALSAGVYGTVLYKKAESVVNDSYKPVKTTQKRVEKADPKLDNISILLIGVDESDTRKFGEGSRTDALMVATLNEKDKSVKLVSIPRDSYVKIPGRKYKDKINHAHAFGGVELTIDTVQELFDIPIDYYVKMNFNAFIDVVDSLGGVEVEVPYDLYEQDSKDRANAIHLKEGLQLLDGEETLALARTRHYDNDIERGKRQQEIMKSVLKKAVSLESIPKQADLIEAVGKNMTTNLTFAEMTSLIDYVTAGTNLNIESYALAGNNSMINSIYYYQLDEQALLDVQLQLKTHLGLIPSTEQSSEQGSDPTTTANRNQSELKAQGDIN